ncbi:hypothetical protein EOY42_26145 [Salmonella enterica]|nr:hypothetical protein [Salmonella enterica]EBD7602344.1 hypothetical protein [Salmonella enterica]
MAAPPRTGSPRTERQPAKTGNKPPEKLPRTRRIYFNRPHGYSTFFCQVLQKRKRLFRDDTGL